MNFKINSDDYEFDFSINAYTLNNSLIIDSYKPNNIEDEIFNVLCEAFKDKGEYRLIGVIDSSKINYCIERLYKWDNFCWNNIFYDEFSTILNSIVDKDNFHRIHNHLLY